MSINEPLFTNYKNYGDTLLAGEEKMNNGNDNKTDDILNDLPVVEFNRECRNCGATDWTACNLTIGSRFVSDCNKCPEKLKNGNSHEG